MTMHTNIEDAPDAIDVHAGLRLRAIRKERGWSQERLAEAVGITFQQIQKYERGANRISLSRAFRMMEALNAAVSNLFDGLPQEWECGAVPSSFTAWLLTERGQEWAQLGEDLASEDFRTVADTVALLVRGRR